MKLGAAILPFLAGILAALASSTGSAQQPVPVSALPVECNKTYLIKSTGERLVARIKRSELSED